MRWDAEKYDSAKALLIDAGKELIAMARGALVSEVEKRVKGDAHKIYLETGLLASNLLMFYTKLGYSGEAVLRRHYGGFDWIVFSKFI